MAAGPAGSTVRRVPWLSRTSLAAKPDSPGDNGVASQPSKLCPGGRGASPRGSARQCRRLPRRWSGSGSWRPHWASPAARRSSIPRHREAVAAQPRHAEVGKGKRHPPCARAGRRGPAPRILGGQRLHRPRNFVSGLALRVAVSAPPARRGSIFPRFRAGRAGCPRAVSEQVVEQVGTFGLKPADRRSRPARERIARALRLLPFEAQKARAAPQSNRAPALVVTEELIGGLVAAAGGQAVIGLQDRPPSANRPRHRWRPRPRRRFRREFAGVPVVKRDGVMGRAEHHAIGAPRPAGSRAASSRWSSGRLAAHGQRHGVARFGQVGGERHRQRVPDRRGKRATAGSIAWSTVGMGAARRQIGARRSTGRATMLVEQHPDPGRQPADRKDRQRAPAIQRKEVQGMRLAQPEVSRWFSPAMTSAEPPQRDQGRRTGRCADAGKVGSAMWRGPPPCPLSLAGGTVRATPPWPVVSVQVPAASRPQSGADDGVVRAGLAPGHALGLPASVNCMSGGHVGPAVGAAIDPGSA